MSTQDFAELQLFITGPTFIRPEVRQAGLLPEFGHRDSENNKRFKPVMENLKKLAGCGDDYNVIIFNGSGSSAMEATVRSLVADDETVLNVSVGAFGDLYHKMAVVNGKKAVQLKFAAGEAIDLGKLEAALAEHKPACVTFTHNETSTGVTNDMKAVCALVRKFGALPLVDGVSIFGGAAIDLTGSGAATYATSTQKSLALPAGFGLLFATPEAIEKAKTVKNKGFATDIVAQLGRASKNQTLTTPNCTLANQMCVQLDYIVNTEGIANRFARHEKMRGMVADFVASLPGFELLAPEGHRSATLTAVRVPAGVTVAELKKVKEAMRAKGYLFDPGYGKLNTELEEKGQRVLIRLGHMGDITPEMLAKYLEALKPELVK
ncbi:MAG: aminotransferase class V-fold PLP-dependent enzyme [Humidesulfovibrio sp.]|uniref:pyridoxal-phosphate-dependent aminotransferase family protein n=1 Tax=Humidesulfovibrio sp. TaxID=2910988 RepID=UPI0027EB1826|nr:aminotransferase class V-fold PLP-dependent enzyme [Humidesulfovibrio sp.]MDQ7835087.1 aminotransferase class V-fold PLP-dependent enzyme [Humidesulfovibrio sp.]